MSSQPPKDFLALSHGHEWVNFYESFDKLVQDHLSRSSELLRKAMSLPEVADREVAQIRDDLEGQLTIERQQHQTSLISLKQEIANSKQQMSALTQMVGSLMANMERLTGSVDSALAQAAEAEAAARLKSAHTPTTETSATTTVESSVVQEWSSEPAAEVTAEETSDDDQESPEWSELTAEAKDEPDDEIDLTALAAMEEGPTDGEASDATDDAPDDENVTAGGERVRPHWLSMARSGSGQ